MFDDADKFLKIAVGLGVLAAGAGVGYHYGIYLPEIEREKIERMENIQKEKQDRILKQQTVRKERYDSCKVTASSIYMSGWNSQCKILKRKDSCLLPSSIADSLNSELEMEKKRCLDEFKSGI